MRRAGFSVALFPLLLASVALIVAPVPAVGAVASAAGCAITQTHAINGTVKTKISFVNKTPGTVKVYWLSYSGKRVYYWTLAPGASYTQATFDTHPWVILTSSGACIGYVIAPKAQYVISGTATVLPARTAPAAAYPPQPPWVYRLINDHNLSITTEGTWVDLAAPNYQNCAKERTSATPNWTGVENYVTELGGALGPQFLTYTRELPGWIEQLRTLKSKPPLALALSKLTAALRLHDQEDGAWIAALAALKSHDCNGFLTNARAAESAGKPAWADDVAGTLALAGVYGQTGRVRRDDPYATKI